MTTKKSWTVFGLGLVLGLILGLPGGAIAAGGCPEVKVTQEVLDAFCEGRQAHVCADPCPEVPPCPDPCQEPEEDCTGEPEIRVVPAAGSAWGEEGVDWTWETEVTLEVDWTVLVEPSFDQAIATFAFRWDEGQAWRPAIGASWTDGSRGSSSSSCDWRTWTSCVEAIAPDAPSDWKLLLGVAGTFGK